MTHLPTRPPWTRALHALCLLAAACLGAPPLAHAQSSAPSPSPSRGQLLYSTHCSECHSSQVHWRQKKQVRDWPSLTAQVRFWQTQASLNWTEDDVMQVASYLNATYYRMPPQAERKVASR